jgi:hypothetical protein
MADLTASSIHGVRYAIISGQYRFAAVDVARKFGYPNPYNALQKLCKKVYTDIFLSGCRETIDFDGMLALAQNAVNVSPEFVDALFSVVKQNKILPQDDDNSPDFNDPAAAERAWKKQCELRKAAEQKVQELKEILGDGREYKTVRSIPWLADVFDPSKSKYLIGIIGNLLAKLSIDMSLPMRKCLAFGYSNSDTRNMYHVDAIQKLYEQLALDPDKLAKYRRKHFIRMAR